jgi:hypothetical protein
MCTGYSRKYDIDLRVQVAQSMKWLAIGCMNGVQFPVGTGYFLFAPIPDQLWGPPNVSTNGYHTFLTEHLVVELPMKELYNTAHSWHALM